MVPPMATTSTAAKRPHIHLTRQTFAIGDGPRQKGQIPIERGVEEIFHLVNTGNKNDLSVEEFKSGFLGGLEVQSNVVSILEGIRTNASGHVTQVQFVSFFKILSDAIFKSLDVDGDDYITQEELKKVSIRFRPDWSEQRHMSFLRTLDRDHSGTVSHLEFYNFIVVECLRQLQTGNHGPIITLLNMVCDANYEMTLKELQNVASPTVLKDPFGIDVAKEKFDASISHLRQSITDNSALFLSRIHACRSKLE